MKVLITGSSGYIGKNLIEQLSNKYKLYTPSHKELDLLDEFAVDKYFKKNRIDVVVYCAVIGGSRKSEQVEDAFYKNTRMFFNIVKNKKYFKKMINLGSGAEYDSSRPLVKVKEIDFDQKVPINDYGFYKYVCAKYIQGVDNIVNLRIFGMFGKYENYKLRFISNAVCKNIFELPITMKQNVFFDYVYINDFAKIVDYFINYKTSEKFYNIGRGKKIDLLTIANKINSISDKKSKIIIKNKGFNKEYTCDNTRLKKEIKDLNFTDFDQSLEELFKWYKSIKHLLKKEDFLKDKE